MSDRVTNVVIAGLGGQGVLTASDILGAAAFHAGHDVKKSEVHGMAQRGGSVHSDVRFGPRVWSPLVTAGEAHFLVVLETSQVEPNQHVLAPDGLLITPDAVDPALLPNRKSINVALLAVLSRHLELRHLELPERSWRAALARHLKPSLLAANHELFTRAREATRVNEPR